MKDWFGFKQNSDSYQQTTASSANNLAAPQPSAQSKRAELAGCDIRYAILFCFLFSVVGYSYTGRFKAFGIFLVSSVIAILGLSHMLSKPVTQSEKMRLPLSLGLSAIAAADNSRAILSARRAIQRDK